MPQDQRIAVFVGSPRLMVALEAHRDCLESIGFKTITCRSIEEAVQKHQQTPAAVLIVYGYKDTMSAPLDACTKELPPIIYWYVNLLDDLPQRSVFLFECGLTMDRLVTLVKKITG